jgi:hypothetical protein
MFKVIGFMNSEQKVIGFNREKTASKTTSIA